MEREPHLWSLSSSCFLLPLFIFPFVQKQIKEEEEEMKRENRDKKEDEEENDEQSISKKSGIIQMMGFGG